ncbi:MAG TPA: acyl-CoA dehydrogenase family protein, partial [Capsulimonadaceae bacterium]|nr:acyl-CoA dehydrogenase family protein [Capsulimonadaceae bacterium]
AAVSEEYAIECALIKVFGTETLAFAADEALQIHGGYGFSEDYPIARLYRDARVFRIFEGTNEINRLAVWQQISRRIERGRLSLSGAAPLDNPPSWSPADEPLSYSGAAVAHIRRIALAVLQRTRQSPDAQKNQIAMAAFADLCAILYGLESAWLRAAKTTNGSNVSDQSLPLCALQLAADSFCANAIESGRIALASAGADLEEITSILAPLYHRPLVDRTSLIAELAMSFCKLLHKTVSRRENSS